MPKLSVIIVSHNTKAFLKQCLSSLYNTQSNLKFETIVVDNASQDGSKAMVKDEFPDVHLIENKDNAGFARGNNMGIARAKGEYILLLNSDTKVTENTLEKLVGFLECHEEVAVVSARVVNPDLSDQGVARRFPTPMNVLFGRKSLLSRLFPGNRFSKRYLLSRERTSDEPFEVDWVSGACLMTKRDVIEEIGVLDEAFYMYWEDADFCFRIKQKGWKVMCIPKVKVIHYEGKSTGEKMSAQLIVHFNKSAYRYYRKHHIKSPLGFMNLAAIIGITLRTIVLLGANLFKRGVNIP